MILTRGGGSKSLGTFERMGFGHPTACLFRNIFLGVH